MVSAYILLTYRACLDVSLGVGLGVLHKLFALDDVGVGQARLAGVSVGRHDGDWSYEI